MSKVKALTDNKIFKVVKGIVKTILAIGIVCLALVIYLQRFSNNKLSFFNYRMFTVVSGSMAPQYTVGDVLIAKEVKYDTIKVGDSITYIGTKGDLRDKVVTHEVINIEVDNHGKHAFFTKGIANLVQDPVVYEEQIYGVIVARSVLLSSINKIVRTSLGFYLCIIIPLMIFIGSEMVSSQLKKAERRSQGL